MKIYTRTGDKGETSLYGGKRVSKSSQRVEAYGTVDELNCAIGVAITQVQSSNLRPELRSREFKVQSDKGKIKKELENIQNDLFQIGGQLASADAKYKILDTKYLQNRVENFEKFIDLMAEELPVIRNFILPGGGKTGSLLHFARSICRRAERRIVELAKKEKVGSEILIYFNRLSDLLFTMSRFVNYKEKQKEIIWTK
ncbi:MAG: cob(I)yrinic acid a,c-diamide adenosyltransferase [Candidatus Levybacteria bacterium]|nr:cob(I)yrinic acid a,c-diamide adenosyltransferase [Candidatus Levybacteria bacterium]